MTDESKPDSPDSTKKPVRKRTVKPPSPVDSEYSNQKIRSKTETEVSPFEPPKELASRLRREETREAHELFIEKVVLVAMLVVTGFVLLASSGVLVLSDKPNLQSWAAAALTSTLAGYFGWFTGRHGAR